MGVFTEEEIAHCKAAMEKPAPLNALALIASGRAVVSLSKDRRDVVINELDGKRVRDPDYPDDEHRVCGLAGAWPLYRAGMIDDFGVVTQAGLNLLASPSPVSKGGEA